MQIKKAVRKAIPFIGCLYGKSSGGKTYSALRLARGLIDPDTRICVIDTENGRASHYADTFDFDTIELSPPFTPARYIEAIKAAERAGYKAIIVDSISHEWDGIGGCLEMAENAKTKSGRSLTSLNKWAVPKSEHRKLMNTLLQLKSNIIFCARAKEDIEQVEVNGKTEIVNKGLTMIQEKNFPFEMLVTFRLEDQGKAYLEKATGISSLKDNFKEGGYITEEHGKIIAEWIAKGEPIDHEMKQLQENAKEIAMMEGEEELKQWFERLSDENKKRAEKFPVEFKKELMRVAKERDEVNKTTDLADLVGGDDE